MQPARGDEYPVDRRCADFCGGAGDAGLVGDIEGDILGVEPAFRQSVETTRQSHKPRCGKVLFDLAAKSTAYAAAGACHKHVAGGWLRVDRSVE